MNTLLRKTLFAALFLLAAIGASAYDFEYEGAYYNVISSTRLTCEITYKEYQKETETYKGDFIIPKTVKYGNDIYKVVEIGNSAFDDCTSLTSFTIPETVTSIGSSAFDGCSSLISVTIPEGVTSIGFAAFRGCSSLTSVAIPEGVTSIGDAAFGGCSSLTSITIPESVTSIGDGTFQGCSSLTSISIPEGVTSIGERVFSGCSSLASITIPEGVTSIGDAAFYNCSGLTSITIPEGVTSIGDYAFDGCSGLTSVTIPEGVTSIGYRAFRDCSSLTSVTIPEGVTSIGDYAFDYCSGLTSVTISEGVTSIGEGAFRGCSSLYEIIVDDENSDFTSIKGALYSKDITELYCYPAGLMETSFTIPETVTSIEDYAFYGCSSLTSIIIPEGVTSIGNGAFDYCSSLTSVTIPEGVTSIGDWAFSYCLSLTSIIIPEGVTSIGSCAFYYCVRLTSITIPESVTSIGDQAFYCCSGLTSITIPEGVTSIEDWAFRGCGLQLFEIANGTNPLVLSDDDFSSKELYIGRSIVTKSGTASSECQFIPSDMEKVTFSRYVESLDYIGMDNATKLKTVVALGKIPPTIADDFFSVDQYDNATLYVPEGAMQAYMEAPGWRFFYNIVEGVPTGISQVKSATDRMTVTADNGYIAISNAHGKVNVYDASGALIHSASAEGNDLRITVPGHGIYIVKAGGKTQKVAM